MSTREKVQEWLAISDEDLDVANLCYKNYKFLHCAFMCQQAVEKILKACITALDEYPDPIHDLYILAQDAEIAELLTVEQKFFLRALTTYAIAARYPERKKRLFSKCNKEEAKKILVSWRRW
ncbi:MAG: HEPN domain protein [Pelotomaculum sp. PtaB.Bin013]|uniref:HEPN domain-containing protein n=1 Tax=Pelotomaculum isophthalicicum JI TaxID=947010 RepID=A0A9X4JT25_9FIRM|nr:HEPN domain-containing protein [Pelotomaculum isophthalicicum]MDF9406760.1 HEPN domain-containing protein [Pelotomaculum isophthalicicum JI]OPX89712.1 MAG: HEPN domain protein [Pelotomaculum sp. PtaB.Bin013]